MCPHSLCTPAARRPLHSRPTAATALSYSWGSKRGSTSCLLGRPPREAFLFFFLFFCTVMRMRGDKRGERGHDTPDVPATFHCSLENVIKRSSSLGGQDYDTSLLPVIKGKPIPVTKLRRGQGKCWTCQNLALCTHVFI